MVFVYFDSILKTRNGKKIPYWESSYLNDNEVADNQLTWFHEGYGLMKLYKLLKVDDNNYIAENMKRSIRTGSPNWPEYSEHPALALNGVKHASSRKREDHDYNE